MTTPEQGVRVRWARLEDGPRLIELDRELARFEKLAPPDDREAADLLRWIFETKELEALVAEAEGRILGMALFYEGFASFRARKFLYLEDLVVEESARGAGAGRALLAALAREAISRNALRLEWAVLDWNTGAIRLYERLGARRQEWLRYSLDEEEMGRLAQS